MMNSPLKEKPKTCVSNYAGITLREQGAPNIVTVLKEDGFFVNTMLTQDFRIRAEIYEMLKKAKDSLPAGFHLMVYEAYRPLKRQIELWDKVAGIFTAQYPDITKPELDALCETYVANPYNGIGSGHQCGCAVDVSLCDENGNEFDMGTKCQEIHPHTPTMSEGLSEQSLKHRNILVTAMESAGLLNYPEEWWHYNYGDFSWAERTNKTEALYGPLDI